MTGPEHYREAERLLFQSQAIGQDGAGQAIVISAAQVHATLAVAAATALMAPADFTSVNDLQAWGDTAGTKVAEVGLGGESA
jgi:hypothetical protein